MKILHTSDWHLGKMIYGRSLLQDQEYYVKEVFLPAVIRERPDFVILAGDLYDRQIAPVEAIRLFDWLVEEMAALQTPFIVISGNHDGADRIAVGARLLRKSGVYLSTRLEDAFTPVTLQTKSGPAHIFLLPYFEPADARALLRDEDIRGFGDAFEAVLSRMRENLAPGETNILVSHCFVAGSSVSDSETGLYVGGSGEVSAQSFQGFSYVALGHLHGPQRAGMSGRYSGSPLCYSFDETGQKKSMAMVTIENGETAVDTLPVVPRRAMRNLAGTFSELMEAGKKAACDDYLFITLTDNAPVYMPVDQLRAYYPNLLGLGSLWLKGGGLQGLTEDSREEKERLRDGKADEKEILSSFFSEICGDEPTQEDLELFDRLLTTMREGEAQ